MRVRTESNDRSGAAATELALLLPMLTLAFVASVDFARVYYVIQTIDQCSCSGAMVASGAAHSSPDVPVEDAAVIAACVDGTTLTPPLALSNVSVVIVGSFATVTVQYDFWPATPIQGVSGPIRLVRSVTMRRVPSIGA
jgi:Flp pilus assembly protein TadG